MKRSASHADQEAGWVIWAPAWSVWVTNTLVFFVLFLASRHTVISEIRHHAMGVAAAVASTLSAADLDLIHNPDDQSTEAYQRVQSQLDHAVRFNPDVRYIYTMRRSRVPFSPSTAYEYVVDQPARDHNRDGVVGSDEQCEPPGKPYDASPFPAMVQAWQSPAADPFITADPPYPDLLSGYAPVAGPDGQTAAIVGVDITAETVRTKMRSLLVVMLVLWALMGALGHMVVRFYQDLRLSRDRDRARLQELAAQHELTRRALHVREIDPPDRRNEARVWVDRYDLKVVVAGHPIFQYFDLDHDGFCFLLAARPADTLTRSLLMAAAELLRERWGSDVPTATPILPYVDPRRPADVLDLMNRMLSGCRPDAPPPAMLYGLVDFTTERLVFASQGFPVPIGIRPPGAGYLEGLERVESGQQVRLQSGDVVLVAGPQAEDEEAWLTRVQATIGPALAQQLPAWLAALPDRPRLAIYYV